MLPILDPCHRPGGRPAATSATANISYLCLLPETSSLWTCPLESLETSSPFLSRVPVVVWKKWPPRRVALLGGVALWRKCVTVGGGGFEVLYICPSHTQYLRPLPVACESRCKNSQLLLQHPVCLHATMLPLQVHII